MELLDKQKHADLRIQQPSWRNDHFRQIMVNEFSAAASVCPIFLTKNPETGDFYAGALFGFTANENLLAEQPEIAGAFQPLDLAREAFYITGENISIDPEHSRFSETAGEPLFESDGEPSDVLRKIQRVLGQMNIGMAETERFIAALLADSLVEPLDISLRFDDGETVNLQGLYTVSLDRLHELDDAQVLALFRAGHLQLIYTMAASLKQVNILAHRRNMRLTAAA
ncbi:multidrug transporter [Altererythrobacter indicus]|uniref:Multidrug transporter n=1 Tax=Altericroceibacterium indicum TaxID=374177 RepID=A0A845AAF6_9SPHN|nr:SapC family protein [Altericroceibacterium indicum]MXP26243.1 multidrug transporter [Altericroceibacterium indicum]